MANLQKSKSSPTEGKSMVLCGSRTFALHVVLWTSGLFVLFSRKLGVTGGRHGRCMKPLVCQTPQGTAVANSFLSALMEYHCNKDGASTGVASRIFEKGLEIYGDEIEFVLRYLGFLISVNDENSCVPSSYRDVYLLTTSPLRCSSSFRAGHYNFPA